ncbi:polyprenyl synthetase family protein [Candidatus Sumerlaeota bacterium]|nr:polyprenyl synthetase family protein [Candidatus Sumerlaeota bacterium]
MEISADQTARASNFEARIQLLADLVNAELSVFLAAEAPLENLHDGLRYSLGLDQADPAARGKRIRPAMAIMVCETLGGNREDILPFALAIELMHNFALVHDDIEDGDATRHNRPAVWRKFGLPHAINIGDYFLCQVYRALTENRNSTLDVATRMRLIELMTQVLLHTHRGQALDMNARAKTDFSRDDYLELVMEKTGYYLAAPLVGGAIAAGADHGVLDALEQYGRHLGPLFQIKDDLIDLTEGKGRGERGADIREGKRSFLVAEALASCADDERRRLIEMLDKPREETTVEDIVWTTALFERTGAIEHAQDYCESLHEQCRQAAKTCPPDLRDLLIDAADYLVQRRK